MSLESMIGITAGLIAIVTACYQFYCFSRKRLKSPTEHELFEKILEKNLSDEDRRKVLKKLNKKPAFNGRIKEAYINSFTLKDRGKEVILFDLCDANDIEPTDDVCKKTLGIRMPSLLNKYQEKKKSYRGITREKNKMEDTSEQIGDTVYLSELLKEKFPDACKRLTDILDKYHINHGFIKGTKDIWCRDYMPIQTPSGKFVQFRYDPSYLRGKEEWEASRSDVKEICKLNNIDVDFSDINIDGGNVLICEDRAILSDRIFTENPEWDHDDLVNAISKLLECEVIIIPSQKSDMTGHADGMVRFVSRDTIIGNKMKDELKYWQDGMEKVLSTYNLKYIDIPFVCGKTDRKHPISAVGIYVNYLEVNKLIVMPVFNIDEDKLAVEAIKQAFPDRTIETIDYTEVAQEGGLINCTTWVVKR